MRNNQGVTMKSQAVSGTLNLPTESSRTYLALVTTAITTVTISSGEPFAVAANSVWAPIPAPINAIEFSGTATLITG